MANTPCYANAGAGSRASESTRLVPGLRRRFLDGFPLIGVGAIMVPEDSVGLLDAGADLVQVYTGLVFQGPFLAYRIRRNIARVESLRSLAVGTDT